ncbi:MAG: GNAT family N-acetyltransferase [Bacteroidales bacterium]|nr:GNAT family N-acetyltransferase [Bacteroidales bacterium]
MIVSKYGLVLRRLQLEDIELVRQMRNSEAIRQVMQFREEISPEMQLKWFESVNNFENYYYIVEYEGRKVALINDKNMNWQERTSESGLFFWDKDLISTFIPILASLVLLDMGFYYLDWRISYVHVMRDNPAAIVYTKQIGYQLADGQENEENQLYFLTKENFEKQGRNIRRAARAFEDSKDSQGYLLLEPQDYQSGLAQRIEGYFRDASIVLEYTDIPEGRKYFRPAGN